FLIRNNKQINIMYLVEKGIRKTDQYELPVVKENLHTPGYDVYPVHSIGDGKIFRGYESLAQALRNQQCLKLDGYVGIIFQDVKEKLNDHFEALGIDPVWIDVSQALLPSQEIEELVTPYLGGDDPVFGKRSPLNLIDFFNQDKLNN